MSQAYARLIAGLPARNAASGDTPASARQTQQRIALLPLANPVVAARELLHLLEMQRETLWPGSERVEALDLMAQTATQLSGGFERQLLSESFPLPQAKQDLAETVGNFHALLAQGYALAVHELCAPAGKVGFMRGRMVGQALARALHHGSMDLLWRYRLYRTPREQTWRRLHAAFGFAQDSALADKPIEIEPQRHADARQIYLQALLLAVSNPYRFSGRELNDAWDITGIMAQRCVLNSGAAGSLLIDPAGDAGPGYLPEERRAATPGLLWSFDAEPARAALAADRIAPTTATSGVVTYHLGARTLQLQHVFLERLQATWQGSAARGHARLSAGHMLEASVGLHGVHMLLAGGQNFQAFLAGLRGAGVGMSEGQSPAWAAADAGGVTVQRVHVLDQSLGGYRLLWQNASGTRIRVGEMLALAPPAEHGDMQEWMIGLVRWLRIHDDGKLETGAELLARQALPAAVRAPDSQGRLHVPQRALLLFGENGEHVLLAHTSETLPAALELSLPEDPRNWQPTPSVRLVQVNRQMLVSPGYIELSVRTAPRAAPAAAVAVG